MEDQDRAQSILETVAQKGGSDHPGYYRAFLDLTPEGRRNLLNRVTILDDQVRVDELQDQFRSFFRIAVPCDRRDALVERLRGWWYGRVMQQLRDTSMRGDAWIEIDEVERYLHRLIEQLRSDNLPLDYSAIEEPTEQDAAVDGRVFVEQLRLIMLNSERIRMAIYDHHRAFLQRSRWTRDQLVGITELGEYDSRLIEEWRREFLPVEEEPTPADDTAKAASGRDTFMALQRRSLPEPRPAMSSGYIPYGSLHMLADHLRIGWHPDWTARLGDRLDAVGVSDPIEGAA